MTDHKPWTTRQRNAFFANAEDFWNCAIEYFEWVSNNPLWKEQMTTTGPIQSAKPRAMTVQGFCNHLGVTRAVYYKYRKDPEFEDVFARAEDIMYQQKFEHAAADMMNPGLITRDLGIADRKEISGPKGKPIQGGFTFVGVGPDTDSDNEEET